MVYRYVKYPCFDQEFKVYGFGELGSDFGGTNKSRSEHKGNDVSSKWHNPCRTWIECDIRQKRIGYWWQAPSAKELEWVVQLETWITHRIGDNFYSIKLLHFDEFTVSSGHYQEGIVFALTGNSGKSTGPHTHIEIECNGVVMSPDDYFLIIEEMSKSTPQPVRRILNNIEIVALNGTDTNGIFYAWKNISTGEHSRNKNGKGFLQLNGETNYQVMLDYYKDTVILSVIGVDSEKLYDWIWNQSTKTFTYQDNIK